MDDFEKKYAEKVSGAIERTIKEENSRLNSQRNEIIREREYFADYFSELKEDEKNDLLQNEYLDTNSYRNTLTKITRLARQADSPYFAGFDFEEEGCDDYDETRFYLGINSVTDPETGEYLVYDWRVPLASLYYEQEPGKTFYEAPLGKISGELKEKRRYVFKKGKLVSVSSLRMPSDDQMLLEVLSSHSGDRMKTIVESIQSEQHKIIKDYTDGCSVLQGCAGSGKSSIALHKTAYIMYAYRKEAEDKKIVIISPNEYFSEYISSVLPDLGESSVICKIPENIVDETVANAMDFDYLPIIESKVYRESLKGKERENAEREHKFKCSEKFRETVKAYSSYIKEHIFSPADIYYDENFEKCIKAEEIKELYDSYSDLPVFSRIFEMSKLLCEKYNLKSNTHFEYICGAINDMFYTFSVSQIYRMMFTDTDFMEETGFDDLPVYLPDRFLWEDAAAMGVLTVTLYGELFKTDIFYMIADEAQDFSPIFLELISKRFRGANMLFVGDRNQTVFGNSGNYVEDIKRIIRKRPFRTYELNTNYRSTKQIMDFANKIAGNESTLNIGCLREGSEAVEHIVKADDDNYSDKFEQILEMIKDFIVRQNDSGFEHMAVICATEEMTEKVKEKINIPYRVSADIKFLPVYLAKGLEFDSVAVLRDYKEPFEGTSLYTAMTRAMHNLELFTIGE